jgi:hypothetical protein
MDRVHGTTVYYCPMHVDVRQQSPGTCSECGMALVPAGTRFALLRHMASPVHLAMMAAIMVAIMAAIMMMLR